MDTPSAITYLWSYATTSSLYFLPPMSSPPWLLTSSKISSVAFDCGFGDVSYFNRAFRRRYGMAPSDVRAWAPNVEPMSRRRDN